MGNKQSSSATGWRYYENKKDDRFDSKKDIQEKSKYLWKSEEEKSSWKREEKERKSWWTERVRDTEDEKKS